MDAASSLLTPFHIRTNVPRSKTSTDVRRSHANKPSAPIAIPRRNTAHPPPSSPIRANPASPDLLFDFDISVSPRGVTEGEQPFLQQRGRLLFSRQQAFGYAPFAMDSDAKDTGEETKIPYQNEPFLYSIPKFLLNSPPPPLSHLRTRSSPHPVNRRRGDADDDDERQAHRTATESILDGPKRSIAVNSRSTSQPLAEVLAISERAPSPEGERLLTSAFQRSVMSISSISGSAYTSTSFSTSSISCPSSPTSPITFRIPSSSPSPPPSQAHQSQPARPVVSKKLTGVPTCGQIVHPASVAAPVLSFDVAQAEPPQRSPSPVSRISARGRSPYPRPPLRTRRSSSVGSPACAVRRAGTILGTGRVVSMWAGDRDRSVLPVLSNEELERSLEKDRCERAKPESPSGEAEGVTAEVEERGRKRDRTRERRF
ncbi:hypothetical protein OBBRIDRAFT_549282 [Obba rivulosa]|uniref:Uncharacterized protein n=1 Tax=Obba rivulosa TaxID=1052685 RepID=A0A8E2AXT6_9APHY|nr:hypothetical protein OBBRIDRAFT_549282 [Obba rivulosa]